jgi:hypothetical protein
MTNGEWPGRVGVEMLISAGPAGAAPGPGGPMNTRIVICAIAATLAAGSLLAAASALAAALSNGCPSGYQLLSVPTLTGEGYRVPALADSPSSGVVGEGPGVGPGWIARQRRRLGVCCATGQPTHRVRLAGLQLHRQPATGLR